MWWTYRSAFFPREGEENRSILRKQDVLHCLGSKFEQSITEILESRLNFHDWFSMCWERKGSWKTLPHDKKCVFCGGYLKAWRLLIFMKCLLGKYVLIYYFRLQYMWDIDVNSIRSTIKLLSCLEFSMCVLINFERTSFGTLYKDQHAAMFHGTRQMMFL